MDLVVSFYSSILSLMFVNVLLILKVRKDEGEITR